MTRAAAKPKAKANGKREPLTEQDYFEAFALIGVPRAQPQATHRDYGMTSDPAAAVADFERVHGFTPTVWWILHGRTLCLGGFPDAL